ncbi:MAG: SEC-C domain-containing protein [Nannocystaceae bacterium]|nr:SEC-C domain-containing protein [Nannocystaceae bacterium]
MKLSPNAPCPCGSQRKLKKCCAVFHRGRPARPHLLMPARFSAYAIGNVEFLIRTTHPSGPHWQDDTAAWRSELLKYCRATTFVGLTVLEHGLDEATGRAHVTFRANLRQDGAPVGFTERSLFLHEAGRWRYHSGEMSE